MATVHNPIVQRTSSTGQLIEVRLSDSGFDILGYLDGVAAGRGVIDLKAPLVRDGKTYTAHCGAISLTADEASLARSRQRKPAAPHRCPHYSRGNGCPLHGETCSPDYN